MHLLSCFLDMNNCILILPFCYGFRCYTQVEHLPIERLWELCFFPRFYLQQSHQICHHHRISYWHTEEEKNSKRCLINYCEFNAIQEMLKFKWKKHHTLDIREIIMAFVSRRAFVCWNLIFFFKFYSTKNLLEICLLSH